MNFNMFILTSSISIRPIIFILQNELSFFLSFIKSSYIYVLPIQNAPIDEFNINFRLNVTLNVKVLFQHLGTSHAYFEYFVENVITFDSTGIPLFKLILIYHHSFKFNKI